MPKTRVICFECRAENKTAEEYVAALEDKVRALKTLIANHRIDYIDGKDLELITHELYEAAGFEPLYGGAKAIKEEEK